MSDGVWLYSSLYAVGEMLFEVFEGEVCGECSEYDDLCYW